MSDDEDRVERIRKLIRVHERRLHVLQEQAAQFGMHTDPTVRLEIEDIKDQLRPLNEQLREQFFATNGQLVYFDRVRPEPLELLPGGSLGYNLSLGGSYEGFPLLVAASPWREHTNRDQVRSGWCYIHYFASASLALLFFKIHIQHTGTGSIHILDAAKPIHTVWLRTPHRAFRDFFAWDEPDATQAKQWDFQWKV